MATDHPKLLKLQASLPHYFTYFKDPNILVFSEDKTTMPFLYAITVPEHPKHILISVAVDYPTSLNVSEIVISASQVAKVGLTEPFYISPQSGKTHMSQDAYEKWDIDSIDISALEPLSQAMN